MQNHKGNTQPVIDQEEHASIGGVDGKKVFIVDNVGNQVTFNPTVTSSTPLAIKFTTSGSYTYIGFATPGVAQSTAEWRCMKIDETLGMVITWADGNSNYDNVATDLTALTYS